MTDVIMKFWTFAVTLTVDTAIQSFEKMIKCTTKQSLVAKISALQKIQIKKKYFDDINHHCDLDSEGSSFFHMTP